MDLLWLVVAILAAPLLWAAGTVFFDAVHWVLHVFLGSRWRLLRWIAWPHSVHHVWLDSNLQIRWENQRKNVWCHLVPEYLTQLFFCAALLPVLPTATVTTCMIFQTGIVALLLRQQGLDINHRPVDMLDAHRPSWLCPPAYHALHHVWPDSHFSAYSKLVDWVVGGGLHLHGRNIALAGANTLFGSALAERLGREAVGALHPLADPDDPALARTDLLILCDPSAAETRWIENLIRSTRDRQLPPEVWAVHDEPSNALARHYYRDIRVIYRTIVLPRTSQLDAASASRAARITLFLARRGFRYIPALLTPGTLRDYQGFRTTVPMRPANAPQVSHRSELRAT